MYDGATCSAQQLENASLRAKLIVMADNSTQASIDKGFLQSRRAVSAAAATKRYISVLESELKLVKVEVQEARSQQVRPENGDIIGDHKELAQLRDSAVSAAAAAALGVQ